MAQKQDRWYSWYEFTPFSVENVHCSLRIPQNNFGTKFNEGRVTDDTIMPEKLGSLMGIWGSAYTINFANAIDEQHLGTAESWLVWAARNVIPSFGRLYTEEERLYPARVHNPFFNLHVEGIQQRFMSTEQAEAITAQETTTLVDAGIDFNLPILPLLKKLRELDVIIVVDASGDIREREVTSSPYANVCPTELYKFFENVQRLGIDYRELPVGEHGFAAYIPIGEPIERDDFICSKLPVLIYLNHEVDADALKELVNTEDGTLKELKKIIEDNKLEYFRPEVCEADYGNTFSFAYSTEQFDQLSAVGECKVLQHKDTILKLLAAIARCKLSSELTLERVVATTITHRGIFLEEANVPVNIEDYDAAMRKE